MRAWVWCVGVFGLWLMRMRSGCAGFLAVGSGRLGVVGGRVVGLAVSVVVWLSVVGGGGAWATTGHTFAGQFGGLGAGDGQFGEPLGMVRRVLG